VVEGSPFETDYTYDAIDNLTCVAQKGTNTGTFTNCASTPVTWRPGMFAYDSLSRLIGSTIPNRTLFLNRRNPRYDLQLRC